MVPIGLACTSCTLIGNAIGKKDVTLAKRYFNMISAYTLIYCIAMQLILIPNKGLISAFFTSDQDVRALVTLCIPVVSLKFVSDGYQGVLGYGVLPALGLQEIGFKITLTVAYLLTIPAACLFAFTLSFGVVGLVYGGAAGHTV